MNQFKSKIQNYGQVLNIADNPVIGKGIFQILMVFSALLALIYTMFLGKIVFNIVERKAFDREAYALANQVGELELTYLSLSKDIDLELSREMGYGEIKASFAVRKTLGSLVGAQNEI